MREGMVGPQSFCLSGYDHIHNTDTIQAVIDTINESLKEFPSAWDFVLLNGLLFMDTYPRHFGIGASIYKKLGNITTSTGFRDILLIVTRLAKARAARAGISLDHYDSPFT